MALGRLITIGGALGVLLALVMPWYGQRSRLDGGGSDVKTFTAFEWFSAVDIALMALAVLVIAVVALSPVVSRKTAYLLTAEGHQGELYGGLAVLVAALVALVLVLIKVAGPLPHEFFVLRYGARFALFCAGAMTIGALVCVCASVERVLGALRDSS